MAFAIPNSSKRLLDRSVRVKCPECGAEFRVCSQCGSVVEGPWRPGEEKEAVEKAKELRERGFKVFVHPRGI